MNLHPAQELSPPHQATTAQAPTEPCHEPSNVRCYTLSALLCLVVIAAAINAGYHQRKAPLVKTP